MLASSIRAWFWLHLISVAAIALQPSTPATLLGRYSNTSALVLAVFIVLTPVVFVAARWLSGRIDRLRLSPARAVALLIGASGLVAGCWLLNIGVTSSYIIVRLYLTFGLFTIIIWALSQMTLPAWVTRASMIAGVGILLLCVAVAARFPGLLWTDEGYMVTVARGFSSTGHLTPLYWQPAPVESFSLGYIGLSGWFSAFGVSLASGRLFIFALALFTLAIIYVTLRGVYSSMTALSVVILGAGAFLFHNYLRNDIIVALFLALAFYFYTLAERKQIQWLHLLVGLAVGLSLDGHPNAYRFSLGFGLAYVIEYALQLRQRRQFFIYWPLLYLAVGGAAGVGAYFFFYSLITSYFSSLAQSARFAFSFDKAWDVLVSQFNTALQTTPLLLGAALLGIVVALRRRTPFERLLLSVLGVSLLSIAILYGYTRSYYLVHNLTPMLLLAGGIFWALERHTRPALLAGVNLVLALATVMLVIGGLRSATAESYSRILAFAEPIRAVVPPDTVFVGVDPLYIPMYDYPRFIEMTGPSWAALHLGKPEAAIWEQLAPEAIAVVRDYPIPPFETMLAYIEAHDMKLTNCWIGEQIGRVDLYRINGTALQSDTCEAVGDG